MTEPIRDWETERREAARRLSSARAGRAAKRGISDGERWSRLANGLLPKTFLYVGAFWLLWNLPQWWAWYRAGRGMFGDGF